MSTYAGIPALLEVIDFGRTIGAFATQDSPQLPQEIEKQVWGIYTEDGSLLLEPDTILALGYSNDARLAGYPQERGAFATYNKVATPYRSRIRMSYAGSTVADRQDFLEKVDVAQHSLDLYHIVTPEITYLNANISRYDYERDLEDGAGMINVDLLIEEVRIADQSTSGSSTATPLKYVKYPEAKDPFALGRVQPLIPSLSQIVKASNFPQLANLPLGAIQGAATGLIVQASGQVDRVLSARSALTLIPGLPQKVGL